MMCLMSERAPADGRVAQIMRQQWGLVTARQAAAAGMSESMLRRRVRTGSLLRIGKGVYALAGAPACWERQALAACLAAGQGALISHRTAAAAWKLDLPVPDHVELSVPYGRGVRTQHEGVVVHRVRRLEALDCTRIGRLPATSLPRTVVDLAATLEPAVLAKVVDDALCRRLVAPDRLERTVSRLLAGRGPSLSGLRDVLAPWLEGAALDSAAEGVFRRAIAAAGLPAPQVQHHPGTGRIRVDFAWPAQMVALEVDGYRWHAGPGAHARDSHRANVLASRGWTVLRATPRELEQSAGTVIAALCTHLAAGV
jgi:very-short-patch-repair endonuclease